VAKKDTVSEVIDRLKKRELRIQSLSPNRYDGIDLPDESCRVLIFDSKPYSESLADLYQEFCRPNSEATLTRTVRTVEHGMGRSVRGEKDYCVIVVIGTDIVRLVREKHSRKYLSSPRHANRSDARPPCGTIF
jgi:Rad3-related DNA helicase